MGDGVTLVDVILLTDGPLGSPIGKLLDGPACGPACGPLCGPLCGLVGGLVGGSIGELIAGLLTGKLVATRLTIGLLSGAGATGELGASGTSGCSGAAGIGAMVRFIVAEGIVGGETAVFASPGPISKWPVGSLRSTRLTLGAGSVVGRLVGGDMAVATSPCPASASKSGASGLLARASWGVGGAMEVAGG